MPYLEMGLDQFSACTSDYHDLNCAEHKDAMLQIGRAAAQRQIKADHFPEGFDLTAQAD